MWRWYHFVKWQQLFENRVSSAAEAIAIMMLNSSSVSEHNNRSGHGTHSQRPSIMDRHIYIFTKTENFDTICVVTEKRLERRTRLWTEGLLSFFLHTSDGRGINDPPLSGFIEHGRNPILTIPLAVGFHDGFIPSDFLYHLSLGEGHSLDSNLLSIDGALFSSDRDRAPVS